MQLGNVETAAIAKMAGLSVTQTALLLTLKPEDRAMGMIVMLMIKGISGGDDLKKKMAEAAERADLRTAEQRNQILASLVDQRVSAARDGNREELARAVEPFLKSRRAKGKKPAKRSGRKRAR